jgi:hypothetical protein
LRADGVTKNTIPCSIKKTSNSRARTMRLLAEKLGPREMLEGWIQTCQQISQRRRFL